MDLSHFFELVTAAALTKYLTQLCCPAWTTAIASANKPHPALLICYIHAMNCFPHARPTYSDNFPACIPIYTSAGNLYVP
jgi:hypothetical protein